MLNKESLKKYIEELIKEVEEELDEATATGAVAGYDTPAAFSDDSEATKRRKKKIATQLGMQLVGKVESVNEDKRANILNIDFTITEKGDNIFFAFKDKKEGIIKIRKIGSNKIVNFIQDVLDKTYGKGSYFFKSGKNAEFIGGYEFGRNPNNNNIDKLKFESINENRWLELKNDDSMHANKKLAVGLKELKYQLKEVETFFRWYNQIKTMNELDSNQYWKRTNSHIYKIKERIINIARTLQEIEK